MTEPLHIDSDALLADYAALDFTTVMDADAATLVTGMRDWLIAEIKRLRELAGLGDVPSDFFQPGRTYAFDEYRFQCVHLAAHPVYGHVYAWGWFGRNGTWRHICFGRRQFEARDWTDITETEVAR